MVWTRIDLGERMLYIDDIIIIGDFNLPGLKWCSSQSSFLFADPERSSFTLPSNIILDALSTTTLRQINNIVNENGRSLDLCFVNDGSLSPTIEEAPEPLVKSVPHHPALLLSLDISGIVTVTEKPASFFHDFKSADFSAIFQTLDTINRESELDPFDPNAAAVKFTHIVNYIIDRHVPKRSAVSNLRAPWVTKELRQMKTLKNKALRYYTRHKTLQAKHQYRKLNSAYKILSTRCYQSYLIRIQRGFKTKPKSSWQYIKDQRKESSLPSYMFLDDTSATSDRDICNLFAQKFRSIFDSGSISSEQLNSATSNVPHLSTSFDNFAVDEDTNLKASVKLKHSYSAGPDAYMFPVYKKGDRRNVNNYRGISALCAIAKLFELVVLDPIFSYCKPYFSYDQHGFMPKRSTTTNLLAFTSKVQDSFASGFQTDAIYTDLSAAFDKVNHEIAIAKLDRIGFCGSLLEWFRSYLSVIKPFLGHNTSLYLRKDKDIPEMEKVMFTEKFCKVMVWQAICECGKISSLYVTSETMNTQNYIKKCLQKRSLPMFKQHDGPVIFWPDLSFPKRDRKPGPADLTMDNKIKDYYKRTSDPSEAGAAKKSTNRLNP
ncbi:uncharacterized protein LOC129743206 [Uranotaenia lowii]|uniref:uncharacterized protein LOC129743206 n=1 Tax=Uranotaenia lowii TaxID=190385 RepID=UPI0024799C8F|nr:uncharacterized protein LOC129743206 [Uranotaenia lowii]